MTQKPDRLAQSDSRAGPDASDLAHLPLAGAMEEIRGWAESCFGIPTDPGVAARRVAEEMDELHQAVGTGHPEDEAYAARILEEAADIVITLAHLSSCVGGGLGQAIARKMQINRARRWQVAPDGTGQHIPPPHDD